MTLSEASFHYERLETNEFRLLELTPVNKEDADKLSFSLVTYRRSEAPEYIALSYTWGEENAYEEIYVNGMHYPVRPHLRSGLKQYAKYRDEWPRIWIDAICINQDDSRERTEQVRHMAEIYSKAQCVVAWLGDDNDIEIASSGAKGGEIRRQFLSFRLFKHPKILRKLSMLPYWSRAWIVQELRLARQVQFVWGASRFGWPDFCSALDFYIWPSIVKKAKHDKARVQSQIKPLAGFLGGGKAHGYMRRKQKNLPLVELLSRYSRSGCKDPRDRVFAMLGMLPEDERAILNHVFPDYSLSLERVILITMIFLIQDPSSCTRSVWWTFRKDESFWGKSNVELGMLEGSSAMLKRRSHSRQLQQKLNSLMWMERHGGIFFTEDARGRLLQAKAAHSAWIDERVNALRAMAEGPA